MQRLASVWRWYWSRGKRAKWIIGGLVAFFVLIVAAALSPTEEKPAAVQVQATATGPDTAPATTVAALVSTPAATPVPATATPPPTPPPPTRTPTPTPEPPTPTPAPTSVVLSGRGQTATSAVAMPAAISVATFTHSGTRNFIVKSFVDGKEELLVNKIGAYEGSTSIVGGKPVVFDIQADGAWTISIVPISLTTTVAFEGKGDAVSGVFSPPPAGPWEFVHTGARNFIVHAYCASGDNLVQNTIGAVNGSRVVTFGRGPCYWEVRADGQWSIKPR